MGEIIPFPVWIVPFPILKIKFELLGSNEKHFTRKIFFTKCFSFDQRSSKLFFKTGN